MIMIMFQMTLYSGAMIPENKWKHKPGYEDGWLVFGSRESIQRFPGPWIHLHQNLIERIETQARNLNANGN